MSRAVLLNVFLIAPRLSLSCLIYHLADPHELYVSLWTPSLTSKNEITRDKNGNKGGKSPEKYSFRDIADITFASSSK